MYHHTIELQAIARAHQDDLLDTSARYHLGRLSPSLFARGRRSVGLALIATGERLADRRNRRPAVLSGAERVGVSRAA